MAKILLVEDDKSLREIYGIRLVAEGYEIISAGDGEEALAMAVREKPDLILSDVMMPKISGFDMLDIIRSTPETKDIKVIMMTALSAEDQRQRGENLGANKYLVKSQVGIEDVVNAVHEVMGDAAVTSAAGAGGEVDLAGATVPVVATVGAAGAGGADIAAVTESTQSATEAPGVETTVTEVAKAELEPVAETEAVEPAITQGMAGGAVDIAQMIGDANDNPDSQQPKPDINENIFAKQNANEDITVDATTQETATADATEEEPKKTEVNVFAQPEDEIKVTTANLAPEASDPSEAARLRKILDDEIAKMEDAGVVQKAEATAEMATSTDVATSAAAAPATTSEATEEPPMAGVAEQNGK